jgi:hypothetical protein
MSEHQRRSTQPRYPMPPFVEAALTQRALMEAYRGRPPYQQNDYISWRHACQAAHHAPAATRADAR